jgi:hypothetical protein
MITKGMKIAHSHKILKNLFLIGNYFLIITMTLPLENIRKKDLH